MDTITMLQPDGSLKCMAYSTTTVTECLATDTASSMMLSHSSATDTLPIIATIVQDDNKTRASEGAATSMPEHPVITESGSPTLSPMRAACIWGLVGSGVVLQYLLAI